MAAALASAVVITCLTSAAMAEPAPYDAAKATMQQRTSVARQAAAGNVEVQVWDFVIADRKAKVVTLLACATNIRPTDPAEFFVTPLASGKDYESLAVTFAKPADVTAALDFIGLMPGLPIDPEKNRYWSRGPRVLMHFKTGDAAAVRAEALVVNTRTGTTLPLAGLVYTGSQRTTDADGKPRAADNDARAIAPTYNDPAALFDVPAQAMQSEVYGFRKPSPAFTAKPGEIIEITFSEGTSADAVPQWSGMVKAGLVDGQPRFAFQAVPPDAQATSFNPTAADDLPHFVASVAKAADGTRDLFTTVNIETGVLVADVRNLYAVLQAVEKDRGIKLDAPLAADLFYRSFFPQPEWRDRATRLGEPWELFLSRDGDRISARLERSVDNPDRNAPEPKIVESMTPANPATFVKHVNDNASRWSRTIFVYPPADLTYGELMTWVRPVLPTYSRVFVFPPTPPASQPTP